MQFYFLDKRHRPVPTDMLTWARRVEDKAQWRVGEDRIGPAYVSTVFLGLDHRMSDEGPPVLFETMTFWPGHALDQECERYCTWKEAEAGHRATVERVRALVEAAG